MSYRALIRRNSDGEKRLCEYPYEYSDFIWTDGNWSCDCNRDLDFYRAKGEISPREHTGTCLGGGAYSVLVIEDDQGRAYWPDGPIEDDDCIPDISVFDFSTLKPGETRTIDFQPHKWKAKEPFRYYVCEACGETKDFREGLVPTGNIGEG